MIGSFVSVSIWADARRHAATTASPPSSARSLVGLVVAMVASGTLNVMIERVAYRPLRNAPKLAPLITAIGMSFILQNVGLLWRAARPTRPRPHRLAEGRTSRSSASPSSTPTSSRSSSRSRCSIALLWFVGLDAATARPCAPPRRTPTPRALMGINVDRTISLTFLLGGLLAGAAGMIYALYNGTIQFNQGFTAGLIAFTAAVMGGIGNLKGAVVGGLIIGVIQAISRHPLRPGVDPRGGLRDPDPGHGLPPAGPVRRGDAGGMSLTAAASPARQRHEPRGACCPTGRGALHLPGPRDPLPLHPRPAHVGARRPARRVDPDPGLHHHGPGAEHRRRLRRPARPRLRRLLRDRRLRHGLARLPAVPRRRRRQGHPHPHAVEDRRSARDVPGIHVNFFLVIFIAAAFTGAVGRHPRRADAAPARRLPGDRDARLRRDRPARLRERDERHLRHRRDRLLQRPPGHHADRQDQPALDRRRRSTIRSSSNRLLRRRWRWSCS